LACKDSFTDYIYNKICNLQLINIQDVCMGIAVSLYHDYDIPDGVLTKTQLKTIRIAEDRSDFKYDAEFLENLKPVQSWLVKLICKAVQKKEIKPLVLGLSMDGEVDPKRTYVSDYKVLRWLGYRGIDVQIYNFDCGMGYQMGDRITAIDEAITHESQLLSDKINYRDTYEPEFDSREQDYPAARDKIHRLESSIYRLERENEKLKLDKRKPVSSQAINKSKERHAVKREQVLGAALSILASYPEQCRNKAGNIEATKIRALIEEKGLLFWPDTGEPVLSTEGTERLIREWLKKTGE
jgi:hypothetical protein